MVFSIKHSLKMQPFFAILVFVGLSGGVDINGILSQRTSLSSSGSSSLAASMPCVQKLLPCQEYLKPTAALPAPSCCLPLKEMVSDDSKCLCDIFNNADMLKNLNITQDDALRLPKACGANADVSVCKKDPTSPTGSPGKPNKSSAVSDSSSSSANSTPAKNTANAISYLAGSGFAAGFLGLIVSVF